MSSDMGDQNGREKEGSPNSSSSQPDEFVSSSSSPPVLMAAMKLRSFGWSVIPLQGKKPRIKWQTFQASVPTEEQISEWFTIWPEADLGVVCGSVSQGLAVLDIDDPALAKKLEVFASDKNILSGKTPSGGLHLYLRETNARSRSGPLVAGVADLKAEGGYVVSPPSTGYVTHCSGVPLPVENAERFARQLLSKYGVVSGERGQKTPSASVVNRSITEGERNTWLTSVAGSLRRKGLDETTIFDVLVSMSRKRCQPPLDEKEVEGIAKSVSRYEPDRAYESVTAPGSSVTESKWITAKKFSEMKHTEITWVWRGFLAQDMITVLSARPKMGKTTVLFHLLKAMFSGEAFLGRATNLTGKVLLLTEEPAAVIGDRLKEMGLDVEELLIIQRFSMSNWSESLGQIRLACEKEKVSLVVIDTVSAFWAVREENDASEVTKALQLLQNVAQENHLPILIHHHMRKSFGDEGTAHRGSGALVAGVDIALELYKDSGGSNRRVLKSLSRLRETPAELLLELAGDDYRCLGAPSAVRRDEVVDRVFKAIPDSKEKRRTRDEIRQQLEPRPSDGMLKQVLTTLYEIEKKIERDGTGTKGHPYQYWKNGKM